MQVSQNILKTKGIYRGTLFILKILWLSLVLCLPKIFNLV
jgi:hypothetical protein